VVARNYRCRVGEADIIAWDGKRLVFVEVKTRSSQAFGAPAEAVGRRKLKRMQKVAESFLREGDLDLPIGLGVMTLLGGEGEPELITEIEAID